VNEVTQKKGFGVWEGLEKKPLQVNLHTGRLGKGKTEKIGNCTGGGASLAPSEESDKKGAEPLFTQSPHKRKKKRMNKALKGVKKTTLGIHQRKDETTPRAAKKGIMGRKFMLHRPSP